MVEKQDVFKVPPSYIRVRFREIECDTKPQGNNDGSTRGRAFEMSYRIASGRNNFDVASPGTRKVATVYGIDYRKMPKESQNAAYETRRLAGRLKHKDLETAKAKMETHKSI
jgi:hypothetical protein